MIKDLINSTKIKYVFKWILSKGDLKRYWDNFLLRYEKCRNKL